jgi:hypothetical protein
MSKKRKNDDDDGIFFIASSSPAAPPPQPPTHTKNNNDDGIFYTLTPAAARNAAAKASAANDDGLFYVGEPKRTPSQASPKRQKTKQPKKKKIDVDEPRKVLAAEYINVYRPDFLARFLLLPSEMTPERLSQCPYWRSRVRFVEDNYSMPEIRDRLREDAGDRWMALVLHHAGLSTLRRDKAKYFRAYGVPVFKPLYPLLRKHKWCINLVVDFLNDKDRACMRRVTNHAPFSDIKLRARSVVWKWFGCVVEHPLIPQLGARQAASTLLWAAETANGEPLLDFDGRLLKAARARLLHTERTAEQNAVGNFSKFNGTQPHVIDATLTLDKFADLLRDADRFGDQKTHVYMVSATTCAMIATYFSVCMAHDEPPSWNKKTGRIDHGWPLFARLRDRPKHIKQNMPHSCYCGVRAEMRKMPHGLDDYVIYFTECHGVRFETEEVYYSEAGNVDHSPCHGRAMAFYLRQRALVTLEPIDDPAHWHITGYVDGDKSEAIDRLQRYQLDHYRAWFEIINSHLQAPRIDVRKMIQADVYHGHSERL